MLHITPRQVDRGLGGKNVGGCGEVGGAIPCADGIERADDMTREGFTVTRQEARAVMKYLAAIPEMERILRAERVDLEAEYDSLGAASMDGMPRGGVPGKPVEVLALTVEANGTRGRIAEIESRLVVLERDRALLCRTLDGMYGRYKAILLLRYERGYSWGRISCVVKAPDSTVRHWHDKALDALGSALSKTENVKDILRRATRARI